MGNVKKLASRAWAKPLNGKRLKGRHSPSRLSARWFRIHGSLRAHVDESGALTLEHDEPLPAWVMQDLVRARIIFFDTRYKPAKDLPDRQFLSQWLVKGARAEALEFQRPEGLVAPIATGMLLVLRDEGVTLEICEIPYYEDERLLDHYRPQSTGGQTTQR